jgi:lipid A ethanolaminephosphotransferase
MKIYKISISHIWFCLLFPTITYIVANALTIDKIANWFVVGENIEMLGLLAYLFFALCFYIAFFIIFAHKWIIKPVASIFIIFNAASSYFIYKYGVAIDTTMLMNVFYTDTGESLGLLSLSMLPYLIFLIILPLFILWRIDITFYKPFKHLLGSLSLLAVVLVVGIVALYWQFNSIHKAGNMSGKDIAHQLTPINYIISIGGAAQEHIEKLSKTSQKDIKVTGKVVVKKDVVVVLALGESTRQKNMTLYGYRRVNTNPLLSQYKDLHILNGKARLGSTLYALPEILEKDDLKITTITHKLGIETSCYVNYTMYDNCEVPGEIMVANCKYGDKCYDGDVVPLLDKNLKTYQNGTRFIILHLGGGSHGPSYKDRYPAKFQKFNPQCFDADIMNKCTEEQLYNSYDNTVLYVDFVLDQIIKTLDKNKTPYIFIYLSDHGESLLENGRIFHGTPPGIALPPEQAQVPLIVKSSVPIEVVKRQTYPQPLLFSTILDLLSVDTKTLDKNDVFIKTK